MMSDIGRKKVEGKNILKGSLPDPVEFTEKHLADVPRPALDEYRKSLLREKSRLDKILNEIEKIMPERIHKIKPFLKQKSTWEGIALVLGAFGIVVVPDAAIEIIAGVFGIIGGVELWKKEREDEEEV